jgi:hypothetical protein
MLHRHATSNILLNYLMHETAWDYISENSKALEYS